MTKLILCEGETDAVLLSYYLGRVAGWEYSKKVPNNFNVKPYADNQSVNWYRKDDENLLICAVGGKDNFRNFFNKKIKRPLLDYGFEKIAVVTDRDDRDEREIEVSISESLETISTELQNEKWRVGRYKDRFGSEKTLEVLLVIIPKERQGALETAMLDAISEDEYDRNIVVKTKNFAKLMRVEASKYVSTDRLELKARLGLTWAVQYPEKIFTPIDEQIKHVRWEESDSLRSCFSKLIEI